MSNEKLNFGTEQVVVLPEASIAEPETHAVDPARFEPLGPQTLGAIGRVTLGGSGDRRDAGHNYKGTSVQPGEAISFD